MPDILWLRRTSSAYSRPHRAVQHLTDVVEGIHAATARMPDAPIRFQEMVLTSGDFLATWAVELAIHHLDLRADPAGPTPESLEYARRTVESLAGMPFPTAWSPAQVVLVGSGRTAPGDGFDPALTARVPVLG